jgi:hypothetical protein
MNYRLYSFVANHYLSPLQCGLQTAHVVGDMSVRYRHDQSEKVIYDSWASDHKTIIICGAGNHAGVKAAYEKIYFTRDLETTSLPSAIFREDEQSMNGMATACGIIVPHVVYDAHYEAQQDTYIWLGDGKEIYLSKKEIALHEFIKGYKLA